MTVIEASILEWDDLGARLPAQSVDGLVHTARVVEPSLACADLERIFLDDPALTSVLVDWPNGDIRLISRARFFSGLVGQLGYGRLLLARKPLGHLPAVETLVLAADTSLGVAAGAAATRPGECRHDDVVVRLEDGALGTLPVAELFAERARAQLPRPSRPPHRPTQPRLLLGSARARPGTRAIGGGRDRGAVRRRR